jgi:pSer/pThr/pTyr-binding forkhead associated (FHA) protein
MSPQLIRLLTLGLLFLIYLFFLRVLRAVWVGVRSTRPPTARRSRQSPTVVPPPPLAVRAPEDLVGRSYPLADELSLGRAAGCEITIDDNYASQVHARVFRRDDLLMVEDLGSTNGTYLNREKVSGPTPIKRGDHIQVGSTVFEVAE